MDFNAPSQGYAYQNLIDQNELENQNQIQPAQQSSAHQDAIISSRNILIGISLSLCILSFSAQTIVVKHIQTGGNYTSRFFLLWVSHSVFIVIIPLYLLYQQMTGNKQPFREKMDEILEGLARLYTNSKKSKMGHFRYEYTETNRDAFQMHRSASYSNTDTLVGVSHSNSISNTIVSRRNSTPEVPSSMFGVANSRLEEIYNVNFSSNSRSGSTAPAAVTGSSENSPSLSASWTNFDAEMDILSSKKFEVMVRYAIMNKKKEILLYGSGVYVFLSCFLNGFSYLWYVALDFTTISKVTVIYNTSSFFAYIFSVIILNHKLRLNKCVAVLLSILGVFIMSYFDTSSLNESTARVGINTVAVSTATGDQKTNTPISNHAFGDLLIFCCAVGTGLTQTLYGKYMKPPKFHSMTFINFSTCMLGVATLLFSWIPIALLDITGIEKFVIPNAYQMRFIMANALFGIIYNASFIILLSLTSPMFAAVGVMLTIPVSAVVEVLVEGNLIPAPVFLGMFCIFAGFFYLVYIQYTEGSNDIL